jgi:hypothetical protein
MPKATVGAPPKARIKIVRWGELLRFAARRQSATQFLTESPCLFVILRAISGSHFVWANEYET